MTGVALLGSTGSIGSSVLDVMARHPDRFELAAVTANTNVEALLEQCRTWRPRYAAMADPDAAEQLRQALKPVAPEVEVLAGPEGLRTAACCPEARHVLAAIVGGAGLLPTLAAAEQGKRVLLANKEALVMSGKLFMDAARQNGAELLPIDSEHNAVFQCLPRDCGAGLQQAGVVRILLTASGGPFRTTPLAALREVTPEEACAHPNWDMGRKISVDSATMMNKGLEVIEACWLFDAAAAQVEVLIHPESVVHSLVEYADGSVLAQLGNPDMRGPIAHALAWPERMESGVARLSLVDVAQLNFAKPDLDRFPCLGLARQALVQGGTATAVLNAANEVAVQRFLERQIRYTAIPGVVEKTLEELGGGPADSIERVLAADEQARECADAHCLRVRQ